MSVVQIDTKQILQLFLTIFAVIGIVGLIALVAFGSWVVLAPHTTATTTTTTVQQQPTPTPTPTPYPSVITFTVLSATTSNGHYSAYTTNGQTIYCANYNEWNDLYPQGVYVADVTGVDGTAYMVQNVVLISRPNPPNRYRYTDYPTYYAWNGRYYQFDGRTVDEIAYKQVKGERLIYSQPPAGYRNGDYRGTW